MNKPKVVAVVGPTASGKTDLAIELAKEFNGEVISCDSRQVYQGLDIGTAKVTREEMHGIPHYLLDVVAVTETYTAADFKRDAETVITDIVNRGKLPIIAGGTFFYLDQLRGRGVGPEVPINKKLREEFEKLSAEELFERLSNSDKHRAKSIDRHNKRRLIRALEIINTLGTVPEPKPAETNYDWLIIGLEVSKKILLERFANRANHWLETGIIDEANWLHSQVSAERFVEFGFEYVITKECVDGLITESQLHQRFIEKNWQYAKRQLTWLKRDTDIDWYTPNKVDEIIRAVKSFLAN